MIFFLRFFFRKVKSSRKRFSDGHTTAPRETSEVQGAGPDSTCSRPSTVAWSLLSSTPTYSGSFLREMRARSSTFRVCVAENSMACLFSGGRDGVDVVQREPEEHNQPGKWSSRRPGVATTMLTPLASLWASAERLLPPMVRPKVCTWCTISSFSTPYVCIANSRVGERITTPVPGRKGKGRPSVSLLFLHCFGLLLNWDEKYHIGVSTSGASSSGAAVCFFFCCFLGFSSRPIFFRSSFICRSAMATGQHTWYVDDLMDLVFVDPAPYTDE
ncbi:hypothetical protein EYF80_033466 [Liparis tanakae]|uniref:Uncharacterized protein n=1 Tax=Liparis tanakae TaxID=230148 RepID=A0A4Z2GTC5_9TELE|nr:hypothetical protein EYF80_033466 [Liparis tanakae]